MHVFVAGATGAIGVPLVRALVAAGHRVTGLTRSPEKALVIRSLGAAPVVADALDPGALARALESARPTHVIHQLTAIPRNGPRRARDLDATNRLRIEGTRHLIDASIAVGVTRLLAGSFVFAHVTAAGVSRGMSGIVKAIHSMEAQVLDASRGGRLQGVVLRYGLFYGRDLPATQAMMKAARRRLLPVFGADGSLLPGIQIEDAAAATVLALERAPDGAVYDIVDDEPMSLSDIVRLVAEAAGGPAPFTLPGWVRRFSPYLADMLSLRLPVSNGRARADLGWAPRYPSAVDALGLRRQRAA